MSVLSVWGSYMCVRTCTVLYVIYSAVLSYILRKRDEERGGTTGEYE